jgi:hypothetical protein
MVDLDSQYFNHVEQNPPLDPTIIFSDQTISNLEYDPSGSPIVHSPMIFDNTEVEYSHNEDVDVMEEERNDDDEDFVSITREGCELGEDFWDSADEDDDPDYDLNEHIEQHMVVKGRSEKHHPIRNFSDISEINKINTPSQVQLDNPLAENRTFNSKEHLQWAINEYIIRENIEFKAERRSKLILIMVCKDQNYFWRLYVVCPKCNLFWVIKINPYEHTYVQDITHSDHAQLTTKMIVGSIKRDLVEDMNSTIKGMRAILRAKISGCYSFVL